MKTMFAVLFFVVLCMNVGADEPSFELDEDLKMMLDAIFLGKYPEGMYTSTKAYPDESTESSSKSSRGWSTTKTTPRDYEVTQPSTSTHQSSQGWSSSTQTVRPTREDQGWSTTKTTSRDYEITQPSDSSSRGWSTTETTSRDYEKSQPDESEKYDPADHSPERHPIRIGSIRGIPGVNFPDYKDIPLSSFSCSDKVNVPGFYADMDTGCQVFHVCWHHRRESFLCPIGTIFNQAILACDYWYSSNCSLASHYYDINAAHLKTGAKYTKDSTVGSMVDALLKKDRSKPTTYEDSKDVAKSYSSDLPDFLKFLPVKSKVVVYKGSTDGISKIVAEASVGKGKRQKTREEFTTEYIPVQPEYTSVLPLKETPASKVVAPKVTSKHSHEIDSINRIIDEVFDIAKKIVREAEGLLPILDSMAGDRKLQKPVGVKKHYPLTKLNKIFITKPAAIPKPGETSENSAVHPEKPTKTYNTHFQPTQKTSPVPLKPQYKPVVRKASSHKSSISPLTKKALTENYLRMLRLRH